MFGQLTINVGTTQLPAETAVTIPIEFEVNNDGSAPPVANLDFAIETPVSGPKIVSVNVLDGTVFELNNDNGQIPSGSNTSHRQFWTVVFDQAESPPSLTTGLNRVATVTFDTTGVLPGDYSLKLGGTFFGNTQYTMDDVAQTPIGMVINNGTLTVVPEPSSTIIVAGLLLGFVGLMRWRRAARQDAAVLVE